MKFGTRIGAAGLIAAALVGAVFSTLGTLSASAQTPPALAACPTDLKVTVTPPTAAAPTTVSATLTPTLNLKAAALGDTTSFHVHYYVDIDPTKVLKAGTAIPTGDPKIIHGAALTQDVGALSAGSHTVWVVVGQVSHQACGGTDGNIIAGSATFNVAAAAAATPVAAPATTTAAPAPSKTGTGGLARSESSGITPLVLLGVAILGVAGARRLTGRTSR